MINTQIFPNAIYNIQSLFDSLNTLGTETAEKNGNAECVKREFTYSPKADYYEAANGFVLEVELPGVKKENLDLQVEKNILTVKAFRERKDNKVNYERSFRLGDEIDTDNISVALENGVLSFTFVKKVQAAARKLNVV